MPATVTMLALLMASASGAGSPPTGPEPRAARFAVVIASNRAPAPELGALRYADDDGAGFFALLEGYTAQSALLAVLDQETQQRLPGLAKRTKAPTRANVKKALGEIFAAVRKAKKLGTPTELYFVYAGHGRILPDGEGAITLQDGDFTRQDLYRLVLEASPADFNHLIIDACNAYFMVASRGEGWKPDRSGQQRSEVVHAYFDAHELSRFPNTGVVLSTSAEAESHEWSLYQGGVFSHEVRSGLLGAADANEDRRIEYTELLAFIRAANLKITDPRGQLDVFVQPPAQDRQRPIFNLAEHHALKPLVFPREFKGRFYVEDSRGARYLDLHKTDEQEVAVGLRATPFYFVRDESQGIEYSVEAATLDEVSLARLPFRPIPTASRGALEESFRRDLFAQPYGKSFYDGVMASLRELAAKAEEKVEQSVERLLRPSLESVAVFNIRPDSIDPEVARTMGDVVLTELESLRLFKHVYSYDEMKQVLSLETQKQLVGCDSRACMAEITAALGARYIVVGSAGKLGEAKVLSLSLVDNNDAKTLARHQETFSGDASQFLGVSRVCVQRLAGQLGLGFLDVKGAPEHSRVLLDGVVVTETPMERPLSLVPGDWKLDIVPPEGEPTSSVIEVRAGKVTIVGETAGVMAAAEVGGGGAHVAETASHGATQAAATPEGPGDGFSTTWWLPAGIVGAGLAGAAVVGAAISGYLAVDAADRYRTAMIRDDGIRDQATALGAASIGLLGASLVMGGGAAAFLALMWPSSDDGEATKSAGQD